MDNSDNARKLTPFQQIELEFPENSGFDKTEVLFYKGDPALCDLYFSDEGRRERLFVTDKNVAAVCADFIAHFTRDRVKDIKVPAVYTSGRDALCVIEPGEDNKTIGTVLSIVKSAIDSNFKRGCLFVGIGGGVVCDMTAFAASMFKRGVDCELVSTTLLSDVDAAIGGKSGCDFEEYKNMIGAFYPALAVHIWPAFIKTLPDREFKSGLAEAIKTAFLFSEELVGTFKSNQRTIQSRDEDVLEKIIQICAGAKAQTVHQDFKEHGIRRYLNYGHTFGHALETVAGLGCITHGEAVAWGMSRAISLALELGLCEKEFAYDYLPILRMYGYDTQPVPAVLEGTDNAAGKLLDVMRKDKKATSDKVKVILQTRPFETRAVECEDKDILGVLA